VNYLIVQSTYEAVEIALVKGLSCSAPIVIGKHESSAQLIPHIQQLLFDNQTELTDLSFIGVNQGPGPFTTLRVVLATVNGLNFATGIPLVGVDGLHAMLAKHSDKDGITVALFNGFGGDAYFGINTYGTITTGWKNVEQLLYELQAQQKPITFVGSGVQLFEQQIRAIVGTHAHIPDPLPRAPDIATVGHLALTQFHAGLRSEQLQPLYLKRPVLEHRTIKYV
jgi:tRNA threonylcarbamoyladenosine biosynthesis protein TsaB